MLINWKGQGPLSVHDPRQSGQYKLANCIVCTPGVNKLEDVVWEALKKNSVIAQYIDEGLIEVEREADGDKDKAAKSKEAVELEGLTQPQAIKLIKSTFNLPLLESWMETEGRMKVRRAVEKQLEQLKLAKKEEE